MAIKPNRRGFSLLELLVVIGVVVLLASIAIPAFMKVRETSRKAVCSSNLRNLGVAFQLFSVEHHGVIPLGILLGRQTNRRTAPAFTWVLRHTLIRRAAAAYGSKRERHLKDSTVRRSLMDMAIRCITNPVGAGFTFPMRAMFIWRKRGRRLTSQRPYRIFPSLRRSCI